MSTTSEIARLPTGASHGYRRAPRGAVVPGGLALKLTAFPVFLGALLVAGLAASLYANLNSVARITAPGPHTSFIEGDTWWHVTAGEQVLTKHAWPTHDSYSFTAAGTRWMAYEWLGEVVMAKAYQAGGLRGLMALLLLLGGGILLLLYSYAYVTSGSATAAFLASALLLPLGVISFSLRPQLLGYVFLLVTLISLARFERGTIKSLWALPVIFLLWVNTHGSFALGLAVLAFYILGGLKSFHLGGLRAEAWSPTQRRHLLLVALCSVLALGATPYGTRLAAYPLELAFQQPLNVSNVTEWLAPNFDEPSGKLLLMLLLGLLAGFLLLRPTLRVTEAGLLVFAAYAACVHLRFVLLFVLFFAPVAASLLARWVPADERSPRHPFLNLAVVALVAVGLVKLAPSSTSLSAVVEHGFPAGAVEYLRAHPAPGPVFHEDLWGGYLYRQLAPNFRVFIDGRFDIYEETGVLADYLHIEHVERDPEALLEKYGVRACLIAPGTPLATVLNALPDWKQAYQDQVSVLFVKGHAE